MKLVCLGDSLTYGYAIFREDCWVELIKKELEIEVVNKGVNGDTTTGMLSRFYNDIIPNTPTHVIIMGGSNDFITNTSLDIVKNNIIHLIKLAINKNIIPILGIETPIDKELAERKWSDGTDYAEANNKLTQYRNWIINFAEENNVYCIDFHKYFEELLAYKNPRELFVDGLHPTPYGHKLMADCAIKLLKRL